MNEFINQINKTFTQSLSLSLIQEFNWGAKLKNPNKQTKHKQTEDRDTLLASFSNSQICFHNFLTPHFSFSITFTPFPHYFFKSLIFLLSFFILNLKVSFFISGYFSFLYSVISTWDSVIEFELISFQIHIFLLSSFILTLKVSFFLSGYFSFVL